MTTDPQGNTPNADQPLWSAPTVAREVPDPPSLVLAPPRRSRWAAVGALIGALGIVGGGVFAVRSLAGPSGNSPSTAVEQMTRAMADGDVIGVMEALAPGERDVLLQSGVPMLEQFKRLAILKADLDLKAVRGAEISFAGQTYTEIPVRADIVNVSVRGGTYRLSADYAELPIGPWARRLLGDQLDAQGKVTEEQPVPGDGATLTTIKDGSRWYVSLLYSVAEAARKESGKAMPARGSSIPARGEDSPEGAVRSLLDAAARLDVRRMIELLPPDEMGVLHDYGPLFLHDAQQAAASAAGNYSLTFPDLGLAVEGGGDTARVRITRWSVDLRLASVDGPEAKVLLDGDCVTATLNRETKRRCGRDVPQLLVDFDMTGPQDDMSQVRDQLEGLLKNPSASGAITVVRNDGRWYVSPTRTLLDSVTSRLAGVKPGDLDLLQRRYTSLFDQATGAVA